MGTHDPQRRSHAVDQEILLPLSNHGRVTMRKDILLASTLALLGCGNRNFNRPDLLNEPRILAIQAEPPQPTVGTSTTLRALVYQPPVTSDGDACADPGTTYAWSWCPLPYVLDANNNYVCPFSQASMDQAWAALGASSATPLDDFSTDEAAPLTNPFPAALLYGLCRGEIGPFSPAGAPTGMPDRGQSSPVQCGQPRPSPAPFLLRFFTACAEETSASFPLPAPPQACRTADNRRRFSAIGPAEKTRKPRSRRPTPSGSRLRSN